MPDAVQGSRTQKQDVAPSVPARMTIQEPVSEGKTQANKDAKPASAVQGPSPSLVSLVRVQKLQKLGVARKALLGHGSVRKHVVPAEVTEFVMKADDEDAFPALPVPCAAVKSLGVSPSVSAASTTEETTESLQSVDVQETDAANAASDVDTQENDDNTQEHDDTKPAAVQIQKTVEKKSGTVRKPLLFRSYVRHAAPATVCDFDLNADDEDAFPAMPLPGKSNMISTRAASKNLAVEDAETCSTCSVATQTA